jgi:hypothetical protein
MENGGRIRERCECSGIQMLSSSSTEGLSIPARSLKSWKVFPVFFIVPPANVRKVVKSRNSQTETGTEPEKKLSNQNGNITVRVPNYNQLYEYKVKTSMI